MPIFESQQLIIQELYGIECSDLIDYDQFTIPFDGIFDLIVANHMLTHIVRLDRFFNRAACAPATGWTYLSVQRDRRRLHFCVGQVDREFLERGAPADVRPCVTYTGAEGQRVRDHVRQDGATAPSCAWRHSRTSGSSRHQASTNAHANRRLRARTSPRDSAGARTRARPLRRGMGECGGERRRGRHREIRC